MLNRITVAGNILADIVKTVDAYPEKGMLSTISAMTHSVGGCVPNTAIDLKTIDPAFDIRVLGRVGNDDYGNYVLGEMEKRGIDISGVRRSSLPTSFSDVISVKKTGERTFFHYRGANAEFSFLSSTENALRKEKTAVLGARRATPCCRGRPLRRCATS